MSLSERPTFHDLEDVAAEFGVDLSDDEEDDPMNITTPAERDGHDCKLNCPRYMPNTFPAHGDVVQCPHGRWFVAEVSVRPVYGGRMAEWRRAPDVIAANLEAIKHEAETPTRGHGECCEPAPADDGLAEWERELFRPATCCGKCPPIAGGGYDCTCEGNPRCEKTDTPEEWHGNPAPADVDPDEALEYHSAVYAVRSASYAIPHLANGERPDPLPGLPEARDMVNALGDAGWEVVRFGEGAHLRAENAEAERDDWKAKHAALRADVGAQVGHIASHYAKASIEDVLDRDDERTPQADPDTVTLRRDDVPALANEVRESLDFSAWSLLGDAVVAAVTDVLDARRAALGWGDSDDA